MKKQLTTLVMSLLMLVLLVPTAFAAQPSILGETLDLTAGDHTGKTLEADGYTWDGSTLTMQDLTITADLKLPKLNCTIVVNGTCTVNGNISRNDSGANQSTTIRGGENAKLTFLMLEVAGAADVENVELTGMQIHNGNVNSLGTTLTLKNSKVTLNALSWMTDSGVKLENSTLDVVPSKEGALCQFWTERLYMDKASVVSSACHMANYGHAALSEFDALRDYIVEPAGGSFAKADEPNTIVDASGAQARSFLLKAPPVQHTVTVAASPAAGGTVSGGGTFAENTDVTVTASAADGYHFKAWQENGQQVSTSASYTFTLTGDRTLTAVFEADGTTPPPGPGTNPTPTPGTNPTPTPGPSSPKTADPFSTGLWIALAAAAALGMAGTMYARKRG